MSRVTSTARSWGPLLGDGCAIRAAGGCCELCDDDPADGPVVQGAGNRPATARAGSLAPVLRVTPEACDAVFSGQLWTY